MINHLQRARPQYDCSSGLNPAQELIGDTRLADTCLSFEHDGLRLSMSRHLIRPDKCRKLSRSADEWDNCIPTWAAKSLPWRPLSHLRGDGWRGRWRRRCRSPADTLGYCHGLWGGVCIEVRTKDPFCGSIRGERTRAISLRRQCLHQTLCCNFFKGIHLKPPARYAARLRK